MEQTLSYVLVTPYTIAKSRTGGVIARLLSRVDLELVGAQMIAMDEQMAAAYSNYLRHRPDQGNVKTSDLLADYAAENFGPSGGRRHRTLLLLFRGLDPCRKLLNICGAIYPENRSVEMLNGETIRDTYADLILDKDSPEKITYFEPAVMTPRTQADADEAFRLFETWLETQPNLVENIFYPHPDRIERTLVIIKPDNWRYSSAKPGSIMDMFSRTGLRIIGIKVHRMSIAEALEFYGPVKEALRSKLGPIYGRRAKELLENDLKIKLSTNAEQALIEHVGCEFAEDQFEQIVEFMSGQRPSTCPVEEVNNPGAVKCMILIYEGENATRKIRDVLGPTDPLKAPGGTVRREFGSSVMINTAHASDSVESAKREMGIVRINRNPCFEIIKSYLAMRG
jgi:nucleoside diphosphate kinase